MVSRYSHVRREVQINFIALQRLSLTFFYTSGYENVEMRSALSVIRHEENADSQQEAIIAPLVQFGKYRTRVSLYTQK